MRMDNILLKEVENFINTNFVAMDVREELKDNISVTKCKNYIVNYIPFFKYRAYLIDIDTDCGRVQFEHPINRYDITKKWVDIKALPYMVLIHYIDIKYRYNPLKLFEYIVDKINNPFISDNEVIRIMYSYCEILSNKKSFNVLKEVDTTILDEMEKIQSDGKDSNITYVRKYFKDVYTQLAI